MKALIIYKYIKVELKITYIVSFFDLVRKVSWTLFLKNGITVKLQ